jgi:hypothetical protein
MTINLGWPSKHIVTHSLGGLSFQGVSRIFHSFVEHLFLFHQIKRQNREQLEQPVFKHRINEVCQKFFNKKLLKKVTLNITVMK